MDDDDCDGEFEAREAYLQRLSDDMADELPPVYGEEWYDDYEA